MNLFGDSSRASSMIAGLHEQTDTTVTLHGLAPPGPVSAWGTHGLWSRPFSTTGRVFSMSYGTIQLKGLIAQLIQVIGTVGKEVLLPMLRRPKQLQVAALCYRRTAGLCEVLVVTSRGTRRWIIPKGWLMRGRNAAEAAVIEAWEEAGVRPAWAADAPIGTYAYNKINASGLPVPVETLVFPIQVRALEDDFPESAERRRRWVEPAKAAEMVDEPELKRILLEFGA